ncbi:MAG TPA: ABC transporter ATP-binding protein [Savagea sp.]
MIQIKNMKKSYGKNDVVLSVSSIHVDAGEQIALTGPSGSGKSTLLHMIGGLVEPTEGEVIVNDIAVYSQSMKARDAFRMEHIGYIFQDFHLLPSLTARENVQLILNGKEAPISEWFDRVGLQDKEYAYPNELSRGQQQRIAFIRALIHRPAIVLADEPTGSLDVKTANSMMELLVQICEEESLTLLVVTHDEQLAKKFPKRWTMYDLNHCLAEEM